MFLALALGMTVEEMWARLSAREYQAWRVLCGRFPIGEEGLDTRFAMLIASMAKGGPEKFSFFRQKKRRAQDWKDMRAVMCAIAGGDAETRRHGDTGTRG
jgi:hypothetical protein